MFYFLLFVLFFLMPILKSLIWDCNQAAFKFNLTLIQGKNFCANMRKPTFSTTVYIVKQTIKNKKWAGYGYTLHCAISILVYEVGKILFSDNINFSVQRGRRKKGISLLELFCLFSLNDISKAKDRERVKLISWPPTNN